MPEQTEGRSAATVAEQERPPNFRGENGNLYLVRCFNCNHERGTENYALAVASGTCAWCGWSEEHHGD